MSRNGKPALCAKQECGERVMIEYVKKDDVLEIINSTLPRDLTVEYIYDLKGVWIDEDIADDSQTEVCEGRGQ